MSTAPAKYSWLQVSLHWLAALGVVAMFAIGLAAESAGEAGDREARGALMGLHISLGVTLFLIFAARIVAHYTTTQPAPAPQPRLLQIVSKATHHLLLLAIILLIISGPMAVWSRGAPINVWDAFALPSPFAERNDTVHETAETIHAIGRFMLWVLVPLHVLGALKHVVFDRDGVFSRMLGIAPKS